MAAGESIVDCAGVQRRLHDLRRRRLDPAQRDVVVRHLGACERCRREDEAEALLDRLLRERLPLHAAPPELRRRLEAIVAGTPSPRLDLLRGGPEEERPHPRTRRGAWMAIAALAAGVAIVAGGVLWGRQAPVPREGAAELLATEAVGDHLRVLAAARPLDIESSASHEVKPWFEGRLDFAPNVPRDVGDLRLKGGSIGYFLDRKAAVLSYALRRHAVTLLVFPAAGLEWPPANRTLDGLPARMTSIRGIHAILWRHGDVGYALVADVSPDELWRYAGELARATVG